jgi:endonuclease/exonuclease/phosphatase (EEP) superfamily protein YafD
LAWSGLGLLVTLWLVTVAGRLVRAPPVFVSVLVTFLPYLYATMASWAFVLWCALPDRRLPPGLLAACVGSGLWLWGPAWPAAVPAEGEPLRLMTWNVRRLWGGQDPRDPAQCVIETIRAEDPDVLTLLEVSEADLDALSSTLGLTCVQTDYMGEGGPGLGGLATCVRGGRWGLGRGWPQRFVDDEDWFYVLAEIVRAERTVNLLAVHLHPYGFAATRLRDLGQGEPLVRLNRTGPGVVRTQGAQSVALLARVAGFRDPTIVAGDFNSTRDTALHAALRHDLVDVWEQGGSGFGGTVRFLDWLPLRVDYAYVSDAIAVVRTWVPTAACSDHRPVVTDLLVR